jgi:hypothetical protein
MGLHRDPRPAHRVAALPADGDDGDIARVLGDLARGETDGVRVQRPGEATIGRDEDEQALAALARGQEGMVLGTEHGGEIRKHLVDLLAVRPRREGRVLGAPELRGRNKLHRPRDLLDVANRADPAPDVALTGHLGEE